MLSFDMTLKSFALEWGIQRIIQLHDCFDKLLSSVTFHVILSQLSLVGMGKIIVCQLSYVVETDKVHH